MHSAHSLLSSYGILTILPIRASFLSPPSPFPSRFLSFLSFILLLSFFSTDFVCQKKSQCQDSGEPAAALWRAEAGQARESGQDGDDRDGEPQEMEEGDDYHIWLRNPQAGIGEETNEAEREEDDGDVAS